MMIETTISGLKIGIFPLEERQSAEKEFFTSGYSPNKLTQNISHAADVLALCQHTSKAVGIDLEISPAPIDYMAVASAFFWPIEVAFLEKLDDQQQAAYYFLALWTAKEANCKLLRSSIHDGLPGPNFIAWLKNGCPSYYWYTHKHKKTALFFKTGDINDKRFFLSANL